MMDANKALKELREKSMDDIERLTAETWGGRALASYRLATEEETLTDRFRRFYEGENFRQEAFEHASMVEDGGELLGEIRHEVQLARDRALEQLTRAVAEAQV